MEGVCRGGGVAGRQFHGGAGVVCGGAGRGGEVRVPGWRRWCDATQVKPGTLFNGRSNLGGRAQGADAARGSRR